MVSKKKIYSLPSSEITDEAVFLKRRQFIKATGIISAYSAIPRVAFGDQEGNRVLSYEGQVSYSQVPPKWLSAKVDAATPGRYSTSEEPAPYRYVTQYNNFYEFGSGKGDPAENSTKFKSDPWAVEIAGEAEVTGKFTLEDIMKPHDLEERIYRLRCVEAWSMVVPWIGFPLADLIKRFKPTSDAKYVRFETLLDPEQMPGQDSIFTSINFPYVEGLRIDEAMNELAFMAVGLYGKSMPPQNGAPLRLVVPWKYGFYANVNPEVDHPRWSQASERRLPASLFSPNRIETLKFNGYGAEVAQLYADMNLKRNF
jgi:sulfoxide reductase catalytic subunit YedY